MPRTNIRIRIPKLLAKTMQRRSNGCPADHTKAKKERVVKSESLLSMKVGIFFSSVFRKKKPPKACSKVHKNGDGYLPFGVAERPASPENCAFKKLLEIQEEEEEEEPEVEKRERTPSTAEDDYLRVSFPFSSFFSKCASLDLFRGKINTGNGWNHKLLGGGGMSDTLTERKDSRSNLLRNSSRVLRSRLQKLKMAGSFAKTATRQVRGKSEQIREERREEGGEELCKKRILMGEKCKPLNFSGSLHYDEDGILLPEVLLL
ncbi:F2P16.13 PROTEIN-RELATED [Salix koriyanagi]|uniref:F2P16.13 PROTEIN-RELATED n=1 Tax=Salix koriyanagi TaxID=2511006 RepID=A0A9Q0P7K7_9ROSI|nr:F2P16.13 PROTEIN-RELATED [Salix koriyanagi]